MTLESPSLKKSKMDNMGKLHSSELLVQKRKKCLISIVIPLYNEENTILNLIERIPNHHRYETILVDDGSTDTSVKKVEEITHREIEIIKHKKNQGYGAALLSGFRHATGDIIVTIPYLIKPIINNKADFVVGSRNLGKYHYKNPLYARVGSYLINIFFRMLFLQRVHDNQSGFRAIKKDITKILGDVRNTGMGFSTELLFEAAFNKYKIVETPVNGNTRQYGKSNVKLIRILISVSSCILNYIIRKFELDVNRFFLKKTIHYFYAKIKRKSIYYPKITLDNLILKETQKTILGEKLDEERNQSGNIKYKYPNAMIGVIIPAFNEEKNLGNVLSKIPSNISNKLDVIVVNDGSTDKTLEIARKFDVIILNHNKNRGNGAATITGLNFCKNNDYHIVIILDADGQHDPKYFYDFISPIVRNEVDFVIGNRFKNHYKSNKYKIFFSRLLTACYYILLRKKISDPTNGYRALSSKCLSKLNFESQYSITQEMLFKILPFYKYKEIPIIVDQRKSGSSFIKLTNYLVKMILMIFKFYLLPKISKLTSKVFNEKTRKKIRLSFLKT